MAAGPRKILVYENWSSEIPFKLGNLYIEPVKNGEHYSFEYDDDWLSTNLFKNTSLAEMRSNI